jgi:hypothetical protein
MTDLTMEEGFNLITGLNQKDVEKFITEYESGDYECEAECPHYDAVYGPISRFSFTNFDEDEEEICNGCDFYTRCIHWSDGAPECYVKLAKIVDETGF